MLIPEQSQNDLKVLKTDLDYADSDKEAQKKALNIKNQIKGFHINGVAKSGLMDIYNVFTNYGKELQGDRGLSALQLMIIKLVNCYIDDFLAIGQAHDFESLSDMNDDYYRKNK